MDKRCDEFFDLDQLLHPANAFEHPRQVLLDGDLTLAEKRAILSSWASDACAVESTPGLRRLPNGGSVSFDDVMDAMRSLDAGEGQLRKYQKLVRRRRMSGNSPSDDKSGSALQ